MPVELDIAFGRLARSLEQLQPDLQHEGQRLLRVARRYAPGRLGQALSVEGTRIVSAVPYAAITSEGGTIKARRARWLEIALPGKGAGGFRGPDFVTVGKRPDKRFILRRSTGELVGVRVLSVTIRGTRWMERALREHEQEAQRRLEEHGRKVLEGVS